MINRFRVWDKDEGKYVKDASSSMLSIGDTDDGDFRLNSLCPGRYIIEQDTGLKDKNGKMIREGDIVKANYFEGHYAALDVGKAKQITGCIQFGSGCFYISAISDETPLFQAGGSDNIEIIGNIHEDKELPGGEE